MRFEELQPGVRVALFDDFGSVFFDEKNHPHIKWDDGIASGQLIHPNWIWLDTLQLVIYPDTVERRIEIITELQKLNVIGDRPMQSDSSWVWWPVRSPSRLPLWLREMYVKYGAVR